MPSHVKPPTPASTLPTSQALRAPRHVLPVIVLAQCAGTSAWFAVNAVMPDLQQAFGWPAQAVGTLTSAVQLGFIVGTLVFALLALGVFFAPWAATAALRIALE